MMMISDPPFLHTTQPTLREALRYEIQLATVFSASILGQSYDAHIPYINKGSKTLYEIHASGQLAPWRIQNSIASLITVEIL